jgi:hypothetical protein
MAVIKITSIEDRGVALEAMGTIDSNPDRTHYYFEIIEGTVPEIIDSFQLFPPLWTWMKDVCLVKSALSAKSGVFVDVGGSAYDLQKDQLITL